MIIDGWMVKLNDKGEMLMESRERPKTHYLITICKRYAIDIEISKEQIDAIPKDELQKTLIQTIQKTIKDSDGQLPWE